MSEQNKGWQNLQGKKYSFANMDKKRHSELSKKGAEKSHQVARERRTAKKALEDILSLDVTEDIFYGAELTPELQNALKGHISELKMYDLLMLVAVGQAVGGNARYAEFVRDSVGDAPVKQMNIDGIEIMTESDRELIKNVCERLSNPDTVIAHDLTVSEDKQEEKI